MRAANAGRIFQSTPSNLFFVAPFRLPVKTLYTYETSNFPSSLQDTSLVAGELITDERSEGLLGVFAAVGV